MSNNSVATVTGFQPPADMDRLAAAYARGRTVVAPVRTGGNYLKMVKEGGSWVYGVESIEVADDSLWAINPMTIKQGIVAWKPGTKTVSRQKLAEHMFLYADTGGVIDETPFELPDGAPGWEDQWEVELVCVAGGDVGETITYTVGNHGSRKNMRDAIINGSMGDRVASRNPVCVPIVRLHSSWYPNKKHGGRTYEPEFEIVEWRALDDASPVAAKPAEIEADDASPADDTLQPTGRRSRRRSAA